MSYAYAQRKWADSVQTGKNAPGRNSVPQNTLPDSNSARLAMLKSGAITPTAADKGHRIDLPEVMRAKMESSFGMDFSNVKLYESRMLGETDAEAMAQGNEIAFAPGKADFTSMEGQMRLGHELSHVASQARGEVRSSGFLMDHGLEARADREGAMAARGEQMYGGAVAPLSSASAAPMAGPMQASTSKGPSKQEKAQGVLDDVQADSDAKNAAYQSAMNRYNKNRGENDRLFIPNAGDVRTQRFLQRHMTGDRASDDELFRNVMRNGDAAMMPLLARDARNIINFDPKSVKNDKKMLRNGGNLLKQNKDTHNLMDMVREGRATQESMGLSDEEWAQFQDKKVDWATESGKTQMGLRRMARKGRE